MAKPKKQTSAPAPSVPKADLLTLQLHGVEFRKLGDWPLPKGHESNLEINFAVSAVRFDEGQLGVEFGAIIHREDVVRLTIDYRLVFRVHAAETESEDTLFREVASRIAPIVAYPYIRETVSSLFTKAGGPHLTLPVLNVGGMFSPDQIEVVSIQKEAPEDLLESAQG
jgi:preprotein translocase subunit SecB